MAKLTRVLDLEVYRDYFLAAILCVDTGVVAHFEMFPDAVSEEGEIVPGQALDVEVLRNVVNASRLVTFNGNHFDIPLLTMAIGGASCAEIKRAADKIIKNNIPYWKQDISPISCDHIDLIEVAPGIASLKIYGGRLHCPKMQDLPIEPDASIEPEQRAQLREYCANDLRTTQALYEKLLPQIQLREAMGEVYGLDLRSKSDAQIAEAVIRKEVENELGRKLTKPEDQAGQVFAYTAPAWLTFRTELLRNVLATVCRSEFHVLANGTVRLPNEIEDLAIDIGYSSYRMGIGGLHSSEKSTMHRADSLVALVDLDVASYYPRIILNEGLRPSQMGEAFTRVYQSLVQRRLDAKRAGDKVTADALKIVVNGSFGKFGSPYSILYSPQLLIQTTITGQLALLMLIEQLEHEGIFVVSANTDGIVAKCPRNRLSLMHLVVMAWEAATGFEMEDNEYLALYSRDVNNYIAIKAKGFKVKGAYAPAELMANSWPNPSNQVVKDAVVAHLQANVPLEKTIEACDDVRKFVTIRTVKGGAVKDGIYLGKAVRWYYATGEQGCITYKVNGYKVPNTEGARPLMELPEQLPADLDRQVYLGLAREVLKEIGYA